MSLSVHRGEILHCLDVPLNNAPETWQYFSDGLLVIEEGHVKECGDTNDLIDHIPSSIEIRYHEQGLIMPGMVDTHVHYPQCEIIASYGSQLIEWLEKYTFPAEMQFEDLQKAKTIASFFLDELLKNGTTTALVFGTVHKQSVDAFFEVALQRNLRMICGKVLMDRNAPTSLCDTAESGYIESKALIERWHNKARLGYAITPRFAPTSTEQQLSKAGQLLSEFPDVHLHTHISENVSECEWVQSLFPCNKDYLDVYDQFGLLGRRSVFAHAIHLSEREWQRLAETKSNIAFCPTSNLFIGSGLFPMDQARKHGIEVGLGTDIGGGDSFSILRTINEAYKVQQLQGFNMSALDSLYLSTLGGAKALNLHHHIGNFETGKEADFVVLDYKATDLIAFRMSSAKSIEEKLFVMQMLGDDRAIRETWIAGKRLYSK